ncbi:hypothetical protein YC2023_019044 [Brassica napus]|uniref:Uncharacterized protein n=1 Tax=Brassica oleracea var. oleracea TaxID=109376 RepID=A0A0D3AUP4_BRAOL|nr:PREDICTED: uncharacterized protein LOC106326460 [Brassica oleracea var. oleracea]
MSLNCLSCQALPRTDSNKEFDLSGPRPSTVKSNPVLGKSKTYCADQVGGRNWSGNLNARISEKIGRSGSSLAQRMKKVKKTPHIRLSGPVGSNSGNGLLRTEQPTLVRSSGMRRNWSFENLRDQGLIEEKSKANI